MTPGKYLAKLPREKRETLEKLRRSIRAAAPDAEEGMSYGVPVFIQGKPIAGYAAAKQHCTYFPMSGSVIEKLKDELKSFDTSKGAIRFPIGSTLPARLIRKLIALRLRELREGG